MRPRILATVLGVVVLTTTLPAHASTIVDFTLSAPGSQESPLQASSGSLTETFNSLPGPGALAATGTLAVGSYTATNVYLSDDYQWGGAGAVGLYPTTSGGTLSITLAPTKYLGFWWSAGNGGNVVNIYGTGNTLLGTFDTSSIYSVIGSKDFPNSVLAADGQTYSGDLYFGNPNNPLWDPSEPFAYVNLRLSDPSVSFTGVDFSGWAFEFDNVTVSSQYYDPTAPVPEIDPAGMGSVFALITGALGLLERRRLKMA